MTRILLGGLLGALALGVLACKPGAVANAGRKDAPTGADALGGTGNCTSQGEEGEPLIVDWKTERRGDLEVAMKDGLVVVSYDCQSVKLLKDCTAPGSYGFTGIDKQEEVIQLEDEDEVSAELPGLLSMGAKLSAEFQRGTTVDIAFAMVGKKRTTVRQLTRSDLKGGAACKGATHYVRGANVGAFAMTGGSKAKVASAAEVFSLSAKGSSASSKIETTKAGSLDACGKASSESLEPPPQCGASIRLLLVAIEEKSSKDADDIDLHRSRCRPGMVLSGNKCVSAKKDVPHLCKPGDVSDCTAQCDKGDTGSCVNLGVMYEKGKGAARDDKKAIEAYRKACDKRDQRGCSGLGVMYMFGYGVETDAARAVKLFQEGCRAGDARACNGLGRAYHFGKGASKDEAAAVGAYGKSCKLGYALACRHLGFAYDRGRGVTKDEKQAFAAYTQGCQGQDQRSCLKMAFMIKNGSGTPKDEARAEAMTKAALGIIQRQCEEKDSEACEVMAEQYANGWSGVAKDPGKALKLFEQACQGGQGDSCADAAEMHEKGEGTRKDPARAKALRAQACKLDHEPSCGDGKTGDKPGGVKPGGIKVKK